MTVQWGGGGELENTHAFRVIPYSGKFLRGPIFAVFVDDSLTAKIKPVK